MKRFIFTNLLFLFTAISALSQKEEVLNFNIISGPYSRLDTPVGVDIEGITKSDSLSFQLFEKINGRMTEKKCQVEYGYNTRLWFILDGSTLPGKKREFFLYKTSVVKKSDDEIKTEVSSKEIILKKGISEILRYQTAMLYPPPGADTIYKRNGFIHPLFSPSGNVLTRVSPPDHYHHLGIWNPWTRVRIGDHVTDFWNLYEKQGTVRFAGINSVTGGTVFGGFSVKHDHIDFQGSRNENPAINEVWDIRAWNVEPVEGTRGWLVDMTSFLSVTGNAPVVFEAYRYGGGIGIRANEEWTKDNSTVLTSEGMTRLNADGTRARWADLNGAFAGKGQSGLVFFSHPANREHPEPMRVWPEDANEGRGDVFFEFCPIRHKEWVISPGNVYRLKYRMLVYDGKIDSQISDRLWNDFAHPPEVEVIGR